MNPGPIGGIERLVRAVQSASLKSPVRSLEESMRAVDAKMRSRVPGVISSERRARVASPPHDMDQDPSANAFSGTDGLRYRHAAGLQACRIRSSDL